MVTFCSPSPLKDSPFHWTTTAYSQIASGDQLQTQNIIHSNKQISFSAPSPPSSHASIMDAQCPAPEVQGTLVEQLAVAWWRRWVERKSNKLAHTRKPCSTHHYQS